MSRKIDYETPYKNALKKNAKNIDYSDKKTINKIKKFCNKWGFGYDEVVKKSKKEPLIAVNFVKDPSRQGLHEKVAGDFLSEIKEFRNFKILPKNVKDKSLYVYKGKILKQDEKPKKASNVKSIDFYWEMGDQKNPTKCYASHKYTKDKGGTQDNQFNDLKEFLENANKCTDSNYMFFAIADGEYYQKKHKGYKNKIDFANSIYKTDNCCFITSNELDAKYNHDKCNCWTNSEILGYTLNWEAFEKSKIKKQKAHVRLLFWPINFQWQQKTEIYLKLESLWGFKYHLLMENDIKTSKVEHLTKEDIIKNGSIFTPVEIVKIAKSYVKNYITDNSMVIDFGAGYGAFISMFLDTNAELIATDIDETSCLLLRQNYPGIEVINENSIERIDKEKYKTDKEIIVIGNPPYNDVTSQYKKGEKGKVSIDPEIYWRDVGISFLRLYGKICAKYICVLHPLSYLIKKQNFKSLKEFTDNYKLIKGCIFSSQMFESINKTNAEFPVLISLYERDSSGMNYDYIRNFKFDIYNSNKKYCISDFKTIDGIVEKYPSKNKCSKDLQFYTLRDINALLRNKSFLTGNCNNGIKVEDKDLHYYAWLDLFKKYFNPDNKFLYGNLSPLLTDKIDNEDFKKMLIGYILNENDVVKKWYEDHKPKFYNTNKNNHYDLSSLIHEVSLLTK